VLPLLAGLGLIAAALAADDEPVADAPKAGVAAAPAEIPTYPLAEPDEPAEQEPEEGLDADESGEVSEDEL
jgi:hypothetical protein